MSAPQAAAITACTACAAVGGAAAGGAFSSGSSAEESHTHLNDEPNPTPPNVDTTTKTETPPEWFPLADEITNGDYASKIGKKFERYLVGSYGKDQNSNEAWWNKKFDEYKADKAKQGDQATLSDEFVDGKILHGFKTKAQTATNEDKSLNKVCDSIYQKPETDITTGSTGTQPDAQTKRRNNLWKYCSPLGVAPVFINDATNGVTTTATQLGDSKKSVLLSTKENINNVLWNLKQEEFYKLNSVSDSWFEVLFTNKTKQKEANALRNKCNESYTKSTTGSQETPAPTATSIEKYCSLNSMSA